MGFLSDEAGALSGLWLSAASCAILAVGVLVFSRWRTRPFADLPTLEGGDLQHQRIVVDEAYNKVSILVKGGRGMTDGR
jgi:hypothetical protein